MANRTRKPPNFISMACTSASVSYREILTPDELIKALATGKVPRNRFAHFRMLFEEGVGPLLRGLVDQLSKAHDRVHIEKNILKIAREVEAADRIQQILGLGPPIDSLGGGPRGNDGNT